MHYINALSFSKKPDSIKLFLKTHNIDIDVENIICVAAVHEESLTEGKNPYLKKIWTVIFIPCESIYQSNKGDNLLNARRRKIRSVDEESTGMVTEAKQIMIGNAVRWCYSTK
jgi:hypothetical protein